MGLLGLAAALGAQALGGVLGGRSNRKAEEKANKENRKLEAITNIIRLAGGQGPSGFGQEQAVGGSTLSDALSMGGQAAGALIQQDAKDKTAADERKVRDAAVTQKGLVDQSLIDLRSSQAESGQMQSAAAMLRAVLGAPGTRRTGGGVTRLGNAIDGISPLRIPGQ